jgi:hypothetical protein
MLWEVRLESRVIDAWGSWVDLDPQKQYRTCLCHHHGGRIDRSDPADTDICSILSGSYIPVRAWRPA